MGHSTARKSGIVNPSAKSPSRASSVRPWSGTTSLCTGPPRRWCSPSYSFPGFDPLAGTLASFATFGVGFFARPIGGAVFGHLGDRVGRKSMLVTTLLLMGGATFLIGLLPTFEQIGVMAPILLVTLRFAQGFAVGGEWGGATLMAFEHPPAEDRNFYASWPQLGVPVGLILSTGVFAAFASLPETQFYAWGWRMAFLLSIALVVVGLVIRLRVAESPVFSRVKERGLASKAPLLEVLRDHRLALVLAIGVVFVVSLDALSSRLSAFRISQSDSGYREAWPSLGTCSSASRKRRAS